MHEDKASQSQQQQAIPILAKGTNVYLDIHNSMGEVIMLLGKLTQTYVPMKGISWPK